MSIKPDVIESKFSWKLIKSVTSQYLIVLAIALLAIYASLVEPQFMTGGNLQNILRQFGSLSLTALGMTFVIIGGYVDLSIVGIFSLVSMVTVSLVSQVGEVPALLIGIALGTVCGLLDALILIFVGARNDADAVFVTFGMSTFYFALALIFSGGATVHLPENVVFKLIGQGEFFYIPVAFFIFLVAMLISHFFLTKTKSGREIRLTGGNRAAARLVGISSPKSTILVYTLLGFFGAIGAIIHFSRVTTAAPIIGRGFELNSILAVVIGGTRFKSGMGSVLRTALGVLLVTLMANALNLIGVPANLQDVAKGAILILAIWLDYRRQN